MHRLLGGPFQPSRKLFFPGTLAPHRCISASPASITSDLTILAAPHSGSSRILLYYLKACDALRKSNSFLMLLSSITWKVKQEALPSRVKALCNLESFRCIHVSHSAEIGTTGSPPYAHERSWRSASHRCGPVFPLKTRGTYHESNRMTLQETVSDIESLISPFEVIFLIPSKDGIRDYTAGQSLLEDAVRIKVSYEDAPTAWRSIPTIAEALFSSNSWNYSFYRAKLPSRILTKSKIEIHQSGSIKTVSPAISANSRTATVASFKNVETELQQKDASSDNDNKSISSRRDIGGRVSRTTRVVHCRRQCQDGQEPSVTLHVICRPRGKPLDQYRDIERVACLGERSGGDQERSGGDQERSGEVDDQGRFGGDQRRSGGDQERSGGDQERSGGDQERRGGDQERSGGDQERRGGDQERRGGDQARRGGDQERRVGDQGRSGGDQERSGGDQERSGGDQERRGGDQERRGGDQARRGGDQERRVGDQGRSGGDQGRSGDDQERSGGDQGRSGDDQERSGGDQGRSGGDQGEVVVTRGGVVVTRGGVVVTRGGVVVTRGGVDMSEVDEGLCVRERTSGCDQWRSDGDQERSGEVDDQGRFGGDQRRSGGDQERSGGDQERSGGDQGRSGGGQERSGGDQGRSVGDQERSGGDHGEVVVTRGGTYLYASVNSNEYGTAILFGQDWFNPKRIPFCLTFYYSMFGNPRSDLNVVLDPGGNLEYYYVALLVNSTDIGDHADRWFRADVSITGNITKKGRSDGDQGRSGGDQGRKGGDQGRSGGDQGRTGGGEQGRSGGDQGRSDGDQGRSGRDQERSGGDKGRSGGDQERNGGDQGRSGGDKGRSGGDQGRSGDDQGRSDGDQEKSVILGITAFTEPSSFPEE
ncbi:predicted protein [Nematostella vectensis]|uniref:MAM domain-containing protein n=1 Tax=Nematostella vectensis TaxID=45351 RepID=A7RMN5_NEMVE|nr:predicted protein [Nematostella vectensis]|eukprot:XP_001639362.1 predicted protein [Nematostella vectensis]